jgi:hypothetical protein
MDEYVTEEVPLDLYTIRNTVGEFFERKVAYIFDYIRTNAAIAGKRVLDLSKRDGTCAFESKAGFFSRGGVILEKQIHTSQKPLPGVNMFYVFGYHKIGSIQKNYKTEEALLNALDLNVHSYYIIPNELVSAYFDSKEPREIKEVGGSIRDRFVSLPASKAKKIFCKDPVIWKQMKLSPDKYHISNPHEKVFVIAESHEVLENLLEHFETEKVQSREVLETMLKNLKDKNVQSPNVRKPSILDF